MNLISVTPSIYVNTDITLSSFKMTTGSYLKLTIYNKNIFASKSVYVVL